jgi:hypothetical protein
VLLLEEQSAHSRNLLKSLSISLDLEWSLRESERALKMTFGKPFEWMKWATMWRRGGVPFMGTFQKLAITVQILDMSGSPSVTRLSYMFGQDIQKMLL